MILFASKQHYNVFFKYMEGIVKNYFLKTLIDFSCWYLASLLEAILISLTK